MNSFSNILFQLQLFKNICFCMSATYSGQHAEFLSAAQEYFICNGLQSLRAAWSMSVGKSRLMS